MVEANKKDAILRMRIVLAEAGIEADEIAEIDKDVNEEIQKAYEYAASSNYPNPSEVLRDVYASDNERYVTR